MNRGLLTDHVISILEDHDLLVGDGVAPKEGGWVTGQPNVGRFIPYVVLMSGPGTVMDRAMNRVGSYDVKNLYYLRSFASTRRSVDKISHASRTALELVTPFIFEDFKAIHCMPSSLGATIRNDAQDPPLWQVYDTIEIHCVPQSPL